MAATVDTRQRAMAGAARARVLHLMARAAAHNARLQQAGILRPAAAR